MQSFILIFFNHKISSKNQAELVCLLYFWRLLFLKMSGAEKKLTRRNLRIKAFEVIYSIAIQSKAVEQDDILRSFELNIADIEKSFCRMVQLVAQVFDYAQIDANQEASKLLNKDNVDTSLADSSLIKTIRENPSYIQSKKTFSLSESFPEDIVRKTYKALKESDEYAQYLKNDEQSKQVFLWVVQHSLDDHNLCSEYFRESYIQWEDNAEFVAKWSKLLLANPDSFPFDGSLDKKKRNFVGQLVQVYAQNKEYLGSLIKPKLTNWDADRVAVIDLLLLEMGLAELLYFPDIPVKVSLNEYIEIAKIYSTKQSGQFVNGVLDNLRKELEAQNALPKLANKKSQE